MKEVCFHFILIIYIIFVCISSHMNDFFRFWNGDDFDDNSFHGFANSWGKKSRTDPEKLKP